MEAPASITVVGSVEPARSSRVGAEIEGLIVAMPARQGDHVVADAEICRLRDDTLRHRLDEENARLATLRARHEELVNGTRKEELRRLKALLDEAIAENDRWKFEMERIENLYAGRESNQKEHTDTRASFLAAERRKIAAEAAYNLGVEGARAEVIAQAAHAVSQQEAVVDRIGDDLKKTVIRAPFSGYVARRAVEVGEWIDPGDVIVEMVDLQTVLVRVNVPESGLPYLSVGDVARAKIDALGKAFEGRIKHIVPQADPRARTFPIEIEIDNSRGLLAAGMFARATVPAGPNIQVIAVPKDATVERDNVTYVGIVVSDGKGGLSGMLRPVTLGSDIGEWIAITSGNVDPGTTVVTRGAERLLPFPTPVEIVDEMGTPVAMPAGDRPKARTEGT